MANIKIVRQVSGTVAVLPDPHARRLNRRRKIEDRTSLKWTMTQLKASIGQLETGPWLTNPDIFLHKLLFTLGEASFVFIAAFQIFGSIVNLIWLKIFTDFKIEGLENLRQVKEPVIIVANHESHLDPVLVGLVLMNRPSLFPLRYMAKDDLFNIPFLNILIYSLGAFRARRKQGIEKSLSTPLRTLRQNGTVVIFPEGRSVRERPRLDIGRRGAAVLAVASKAMILPLALHTPLSFSPQKIFGLKSRVTLRVGQPFYLSDEAEANFNDEQMTVQTKVIMDHIADLYYQYKY